MKHAGRRIEGAGTAESAWAACAVLAASAQGLTLDACVPEGARLVVVAPHPDDEVIACGGLLHLHAARGGDCLVVAVSDGEASHAGSTLWPAARLAVARREESTEGLTRLGAGAAEVVRLGIPDGDVAAHAASLERRLLALLRAGDHVVSTWRLDGHPDHEATGDAAARACAGAACRLLEAPVWMWHWARPGDARVPWQRLRGLALPPRAVAAKQHALTAHVTQLTPRDPDPWPVLDAGILARVARQVEYFFV